MLITEQDININDALEIAVQREKIQKVNCIKYSGVLIQKKSRHQFLMKTQQSKLISCIESRRIQHLTRC